MKYLTTPYFKFLLKSTNQHGIHSPFVYDLTTKCFYDKSKKPDYAQINAYRKHLIQNTPLNRNILSKKEARLLNRVGTYFNTKTTLEIGNSGGMVPFSLNTGNPENKITLTGTSPDIREQVKRDLESFGISNVEFSKMDGVSGTFDLIFINMDVFKEVDFLNTFSLIIKHTHNDSVVILNNIRYSEETLNTWENSKLNSNVTVSIDLFFWGMIFVRKEQQKEHFAIRV